MNNNNFFPKRTIQNQKGEQGVIEFAKLINSELNWIFRKTELEHDYGIDGYIDIVLADGSVSGKTIAVQIKYGESYFRHKSHNGFWYSGETKHLNYYLNLDFPLLLVILNKTETYWVEFNINQTERTSSGWRINIPKTNRLDANARSFIENLVDEVQDYKAHIEAKWYYDDLMKNKASLILFDISKEAFENQDISYCIRFFNRLLENETLTLHCQGKIEIMTSAYDADPRELYEIPEVRNYVAHLEPIVKYWFFFAPTRLESPTLRLLLLCAYCHKNSKGYWKPNKKDLKSFVDRNFIGLNALTERLGISLNRNKQISEEIIAYFNHHLR
ncbi:uncharacterized protein DUF4365 [Leptospira meyeri]|uniref:Uncharacterized protein DUF4365 n=1 Tax=Leptospira meyeri TaxID=29508 RepID=A0A4R8MNQ3_LEPME|nr:DUF4365 and DUF1817 domain-containing protein [Leptospira meyeri]EKJ87298.1 PF14280 domain protein [Leptospira meyeri serovar Hardjo str. Went 5]TDY65888.1 uncharacterized protein DUF4365 [Leptospira meyeri]